MRVSDERSESLFSYVDLCAPPARRRLRKHGFHVIEATTGNEAL